MVKSLVTGGAGFIGRSVVKKLLDEGQEVVALDNLSNGQEENIQEFLSNKNFKFIIGDIKDKKIFEKFDEFDYIYHLAAQVNVQESLDNPEASYENNVLGTYNLLEFIRQRSKKAITIFMGTCMVYDTAGDTKISETHPLNPASPYAGSKLAAEDMALGYANGLDLDVRIVRPFNTYGPYQKTNLEGGVVTIFCQRYINKEPIKVFGDGEQTRDLLYVSDCADLLFTTASLKDGKCMIINGGTGTDIKIKDLAKLIAKNEVEVQFVEHHHPQSEIQKLVCDNSKANRVLNWHPQVSLEEGIEKTINFLKSKL